MRTKHIMIHSIVALILVLTTGLSPAQARLTGTVSGKVLDADGKGLKGVSVMLRSLDGSNPNRTVESSKTGRYRFTAVIPGNYVVIATAEGFDHKNTQVIRVSSNGKLELDLFMDVKTEPVVENSNEHVASDDAGTEGIADDSTNSAVGHSPDPGSVDSGIGSGASPTDVQRP